MRAEYYVWQVTIDAGSARAAALVRFSSTTKALRQLLLQ